MAWTRKILRVNLTQGSCSSEPLNMAWAAQYLGQRGLASKYLVSEIDPKVDPLSPENKLIYATGPLTGTMASTGGRYSVVTKGPSDRCDRLLEFGRLFRCRAEIGGLGHDHLRGQVAATGLSAHRERAGDLLPADDLWGKTVWDTEGTLKKRHQDPLLRVSSIGRAGENQVLFAAIVNDLHRAAGRSGVGAVMGSKNLKAVAVRGTRGVGNIADPKAFMAAVTAGKKVLAENAVTGQGLPTYGTQVLMNVINEMGASPTRNHRDVQFEGARKISAEAMHEKRATDGSDTSGHQSGLLWLHHRLRADLTHRRDALLGADQDRNIGVPTVASNTRAPGHSATPTASTILKRCSTPTCCATKTAWIRSRSARRSVRSWSFTTWVS
jgi:aldehyde:ferredoxin oxidoreductase